MIGTLVRAASGAVGLGLAGAIGVIDLVRRAPKPLHPRGTVWRAELVRDGTDLPTGVPWLDDAGSEAAVVRISAAIGLPRGWPDIRGVAVHLPERDADLLFASTGSGPWSRFVLRFVGPHTEHLASTLLPYRGPFGPVVLAVVRLDERRFGLLCAQGTGPWMPFGRLWLVEQLDRELSFDPVLRPLPGLPNHRWVEALRAPAYRTARRSRT